MPTTEKAGEEGEDGGSEALSSQGISKVMCMSRGPHRLHLVSKPSPLQKKSKPLGEFSSREMLQSDL